jgi:hypothetical protein
VPILHENLGRYCIVTHKKVRTKRSETNPTGWETVETTTDLPFIDWEDIKGNEFCGYLTKKGLGSLKREGDNRYSLSDRDAKKLIVISADRQACADAAKKVKDELNAIIMEIPPRYRERAHGRTSHLSSGLQRGWRRL